ncbi:MAG: M20/M25/M40 family metallo-hydrolase, partial [Planctomycetes bacterium]|nr:M20/M25/M40 family metallo-hydrolase [Planctomycetota bacterium]
MAKKSKGGGIVRTVAKLAGSLALFLVGKTLLLSAPEAVESAGASAGFDVDATAVAGRLGEVLRFQTISHRDEARVDREPFEAQRAWLAASYPRVHDPALVERHDVGEGQLFLLSGSDPQAAPLLLLAHLDVVPAEGASLGEWTHPPFSGAIADGYVWGRGALDDKASAICIFEAMEHMLAQGVRPVRSLIFAAGEDEEVLGERGAAKMAAWLAERGVRPFMVLDEGMALVDGVFDGVESEVGLIGVSERGYATLELLVEAEGGHSSMPPERTAVFALSRALARLEERPMPAHTDGVVGAMLDRLGHEQPLLQQVVTSNRWLFNPLVVMTMEAAPGPNAMLRTTFAPTVVRAGEVENALPTQARAWVNARVHPSDSIPLVLEHVKDAVAGLGVEVSLVGTSSPPSPISPYEGPAWETLRRALASVEPGAVQAPGLVVGATDARHYASLSPNVYRFLPLRLKPEDLPRIHGVDERVGVEN